MGDAPATVGIGAASAGLGLFDAFGQGRAAKQTAKNISRAAAFQRGQALAQREADTQRLGREQTRVLGAIRAATSSRGITGSRTANQIQSAAIYDGLYTQSLLDNSFSDEVTSTNITERDQIRSLKGPSPILSGFAGGLSGLSLGMNLDSILQRKDV